MITSSATPTTDGFADSYRPTSSGGCFSSVYVPAQTGIIQQHVTSFGDGTYDNTFVCSSCGTMVGRSGVTQNGPTSWGTTTAGGTHVCREAYYDVKLTCGYTRGQVIRAVIEY